MQSCVAGGTQASLAALRLQSSADSASSLGSDSWLALWPLQHGVGLRHGAPPWGLCQAAWQGLGASRRRCRRPAAVSVLMRRASGAPTRLRSPWPRGGALVTRACEHDDAADVPAGRRLTISKSERDDTEREREKAHRAAAASTVRARGFGAAAESAKKAGERRQQRKPRQRQPVRLSMAASALLPVPVRRQPAEPFLLPSSVSPGAKLLAWLARASRARVRRPAARRRSRPTHTWGSQTRGMWWAACCPAWRSWWCWRCCRKCAPRRAWRPCSSTCATCLSPLPGVRVGARQELAEQQRGQPWASARCGMSL